MDYKDIKRLVGLVEEANISHLSIDENGTKIEIKKEAVSSTTQVVMPQTASPMPQPVAQAAPAVSDAPSAPVDTPSDLIEVKAEMVGTFYSSPNPESPAFVKIGDTIQKGQVVCIIEAMKLFNEIESEQSGIVEEICVKDSDAIEYGQVLFRLRKA